MTHLEKFFSSYPKFEYDPSGPASQQYQVLKSIVPKNVRQKASKGYSKALVATFKEKYGYDVNSLESWQKLCRAVEFSPVPNSVAKFNALTSVQLIEDAHINIIDLLDIHTTGEPVHRFATEKQLSCYPKRTGKMFPATEAMGSLLQYLLRHIFRPPPEHLMWRDGQLVERNS
ncbi:hypothetical protein C8J57DRAFT_1083001 [Mycena rebaudengoi]|nr:hypothetical protein C8J57DRAFT_1083001 [Mycena rebaudengoi]